jgi:hypothetical protein
LEAVQAGVLDKVFSREFVGEKLAQFHPRAHCSLASEIEGRKYEE